MLLLPMFSKGSAFNVFLFLKANVFLILVRMLNKVNSLNGANAVVDAQRKRPRPQKKPPHESRGFCFINLTD